MKFTPLKFQAPLAAGGIALMAFNYLQFSVPHGQGLIQLADILWARITLGQMVAYFPLIVAMLVFMITNLILAFIFLRQLIGWVSNKKDFKIFINDPLINVGVFVPIASLAMTVNVIWGPLAFFFPQLSAQAMMMPSLIFFGLVWTAFFLLEFKVLKTMFTQTFDLNKLNFIWLLDVFALGLVNLTGTGIASISSDKGIASIAAFASLFGLSIGMFLLITKLAYLIYMQIKFSRLPEKPILPAYFMVIPITCLYGLSLYRIMVYLQNYFLFDVKVLSFFLITFSYAITIGWAVFTLYLLYDYFKKDFIKSTFSAPQWAMV